MMNKIQAPIDKNYCKVWMNKEYMKSKFAAALAVKLKERGMKAIELAEKTKSSRANISRLLNDTPHPITGALPKPNEETVEKISKALDWDIDEARLAAGYAPTKTSGIPEQISRHDFSQFDEKDLESISDFIKFKLLDKQVKPPKPKITAEEAIEFLRSQGGITEYDISGGGIAKTDIGKQGDKGEQGQKKHNLGGQ